MRYSLGVAVRIFSPISIILIGAFVLVTGCRSSSPEEETVGNLTPKTVVASNGQLLELGKQTFQKQCAPCHGVNGDGQGPAAYLLFPKPRNFVSGRFRLISTWDGAPRDEDLFKTISRGMPGSAMPSWGHLT